MYEMNRCSAYWNIVPQTQLNVFTIRLLLVTTLFLLYIMYIVISIIFRKSIQNLRTQNDPSPKLLQVEQYFNKWQKQYLLMFGDHMIAVGFVICFSPFQFQIILAIVHLIVRLIYEIRKHKYDSNIKEIKTMQRIINLALLICAMIGLSRAHFDQENNKCRDSDFQF